MKKIMGSLFLLLFVTACSPRDFSIVVEYAPVDGFMQNHQVIKNVSRPIDSPEKACAVWSQYLPAYACHATEQERTWALENPLICDPKSPIPCGGSCTGIMDKKTGNIKNLTCQGLM
jgi:hypothetical protein